LESGLKKVLGLTILLSLFTTNTYALDINELKTKLRPYVERYLGDQTANKLFGEKKSSITLPSIPKVEENAKSIADLDVKDPNQNVIPKDKRQKFNYAYVKEVFEAVRKAEPNENDLVKWINVMDQGATHEGVYRALVLDSVYKGMENYQNDITNPVKKFVVAYYDKFLALGVEEESLSSVNFYYMKRETVEKTLEVADAFIIRDKSDLYRWYAIFSSQLAKEYPDAFSNKLRRNQNDQIHFDWASKVSFQLIKAEIIVKIHKIFNYLMP
jgi:hypothetical protein